MMSIRRSVTGAFALALAMATPALAQKGEDPGMHKGQEKQQEKAAAAKIGEAAPAFELKDLDGKTVKLSDYKGKIVVLEWFNPGCPVVQMHYGNDTMNKTIAQFKDKNVAWLRINSGAPGKQGHGKEVNAQAVKDWHISTPVLLDETGTVGKAYGAKSTPHCFVIDAAGVLVYAGAIDNGNSNKVGDVNYVAKALTQTLAGETVTTPETRSYGCPVKY
jgi:peroxiredoxin